MPLDTSPFEPGWTVWVYLRDSGGAGQDRSVDQQIEIARQYCAAHQLVIQEVFADRARQGDSAEDRRDLLRMLLLARETFPEIHDRRRRQDVTRQLRHGVIFWSFSRLGRDSIESVAIRSNLRMRGLIITSLSDDILTGNATLDPILEALLDFKNELDLEVIGRDVKRGLHSSVSLRDTDAEFLRHNPGWEATGRYLGVMPGRAAPRGYKFEQITIGTRRDGRVRVVQRLIPDPEAWDRAFLAWRMRVVDRATVTKIQQATHLYDEIVGFGNFFQNRIYTGVLKFGDQTYGAPDDPFVPPLIPMEWFELEMQRRSLRAVRRKRGGLAQPGDLDPRQQAGGRVLSGLLVCARCGMKLYADRIKEAIIPSNGYRRTEWPFYYCNEGRRGKCDSGRISARLIETEVITKLQNEVLTPVRLRSYADKILGQVGTRRRSLLQEIDALDDALREIKRRTNNLVDAIAQRPTSPALLTSLDAAEAEQQTITREIQAKHAQLAYWSGFEIDDAQLEALVARVNNALGSGDVHKGRAAISTFISKIEVDSGNPIRLHIFWKLPHPESETLAGVPLEPTTHLAYPYRRNEQRGIEPSKDRHLETVSSEDLERIRADFMSKVDTESSGDCWLWKAAIDKDGFGRFKIDESHHYLAHRAAAILFLGPIPRGYFVLHDCETLHCVNPDHLFFATPKEKRARQNQGKKG
jgi:DNA invertase Pin-like site-specific DNA recombinase